MKNAFHPIRKMEFAIVECREKLRLGRLTWSKNERELTLTTPACILYTKSGCVPHLTHDTLRLSIFREDDAEVTSSDVANGDGKCVEHKRQRREGMTRLLLPLLFPMAQFLPFRKSLQSISASQDGSRGIADFVGASRDFDVVSFSTQHDPAAPLPTGFNAGQSVSLWNYAGKAEVTPAMAVEMAASMVPDVAQILADVDVGFHRKAAEGASKKRGMKAVDRSVAFLRHVEQTVKEGEEKTSIQKVLTEKEEEREKNAENPSIITSWWATAIVGLEEKQFLRYLTELSVCPNAVRGYVLDGLQPSKKLRGVVESSSHVRRSVEAISNVVSALPASKPRLLSHVATPRLVVEAVENGVDLFDSSFAVVAADRGGALVFEMEERDEEEKDAASPCSDRVVEIDLNRSEFADDFSPLLAGCACYSCTTHTKAYVHHLVVTRELLASVLLTIHNQYHFTKFFHRLRRAIENDEWDRFKKIISRHGHESNVEEEEEEGKNGEKRAGKDVGDEGRRKKKLVS